ncbi:phosphoglycolate phosphatase [Halomonas sp. V046]|uniref:phosphoglycolate phosphatase n=1 Tax=Halomonas sp. V046 TaxID=3459611 RepID=UPI0040442B37
MRQMLDGVRLVAFDLDGTLVDSVPDLAVAVDAALVEVALEPAGEDKVRHWVGNGAWVLVERALTDALGEAPSEVLTRRTHDAFIAHYRRAPSARTRLYPGAKQALAGLHERGLTLCLVTNKPQAFIAPILRALGIDGYFAACLGGDTLARRKPDPLPLLHLCDRFDIAPRHCLMIGDSRHDVAAGKAAGFRTLAVPYGYNHGEPVADSDPDGVVESLDQLV